MRISQKIAGYAFFLISLFVLAFYLFPEYWLVGWTLFATLMAITLGFLGISKKISVALEGVGGKWSTEAKREKLPEHFMYLQSQDTSGSREKLLDRSENREADTYQKAFQSSIPKTDPESRLELIKLDNFPLDTPVNKWIKRSFDVGFSIVMIILLLPVYLLIAAAVLLESRGPIFYSPKRAGQGGKSFTCFKFRTMYSLDSSGKKSTVKDDPRITKVGKVLRKYNLDELPQFMNVLLGNMSVVGPRPHRLHLNKVLEQMVSQYMLRHHVKPGITGWAQVNGWRGPLETQEQRTQRVKYDLSYIRDWTLWLDIKIVFLTVFSKKAWKNAF